MKTTSKFPAALPLFPSTSPTACAAAHSSPTPQVGYQRGGASLDAQPRPSATYQKLLGETASSRAHAVGRSKDPKAAALADRFCELCDALAAEPSLSPNPTTNRLFSELVSLTADTDEITTREVLMDSRVQDRIPHLRRLCAKGEGKLESHWAERIVASANPQEVLEEFPYIENYRQLVNLEVLAMQMGGKMPERLLFIGSGPMPLTSLLLANEHGIKVDNLDIDKKAAQQGEAVAKSLGQQADMAFGVGDIFSMSAKQLQTYDAVYVAALAGLTREEKERVFRHLAVHVKEGCIAVARSAFKLRTLLYPEVMPEDAVGFRPQVLVHPLNDVVNSALVVRK